MRERSRTAVWLSSFIVVSLVLAPAAAAKFPAPNIGGSPDAPGVPSIPGAPAPPEEMPATPSTSEAASLAPREPEAPVSSGPEPTDPGAPGWPDSPAPTGDVGAPQVQSAGGEAPPDPVDGPRGVTLAFHDPPSCRPPAGIVEEVKAETGVELSVRGDTPLPCSAAAPPGGSSRETRSETRGPVLEEPTSRPPHLIDRPATLELTEPSRRTVPVSAEEGAGATAPPSSPSGAISPPKPRLDPALIAAGLAAVALPLWLLYHHIVRSRVLDNETRRAVYEHVVLAPGTTAGKLARRLEIDRRTARHHLSVLRHFGFLEERRVEGWVRYYENGGTYGEVERRVHVALGSEKARIVLGARMKRPGASLGEISTATRIPKSTVKWHLDRLSRLGVITDGVRLSNAAVDVVVRAS